MKIKNNIYFFCVLLAASLWGAAGIFVRNIEKSNISEMGIVLFRAFFSSLIIGVIMLIKDKSLFKIKLKDIWCFIGTGFISLFTFNLCYFTAIEMTSIAIAVVLLYTSPAFVILLSRILFKEKITKIKVMNLFPAVLFAGIMAYIIEKIPVIYNFLY